jgi:branched-chain amino acid aminotransferase
LTPYDLYIAEECFLTGTAAELISVREIDGRYMPTCPGPVYHAVQAAFRAVIQWETKTLEEAS